MLKDYCFIFHLILKNDRFKVYRLGLTKILQTKHAYRCKTNTLFVSLKNLKTIRTLVDARINITFLSNDRFLDLVIHSFDSNVFTKSVLLLFYIKMHFLLNLS